jgi:KDO2-lipid IV(A) lauroyltransferase
MDMFPFGMAPRIAKVFGSLVHFVDRRHRRVAEKNLRKAEGVVDEAGIPAFVRRHYEHLALGFVEMLKLPGIIQRKALNRHLRLERREVADRLIAEGKGLIVAVGHQGNWELVGVGVTLAGYRINSLARPIENPWLDRYLNRFRTQTGGQAIIPKHGAMGDMIRVLRRKELLIIQIDQDARDLGVMVDFFGRPAATHKSPAVLSLKYGCPMILMDIYRENGVHHGVVSDPLRPEDFQGAPDPVRAMTQALTSLFEKNVRRHPEQWFWVHDRWKTTDRAEAAAASRV